MVKAYTNRVSFEGNVIFSSVLASYTSRKGPIQKAAFKDIRLAHDDAE